jgi:hypothetical protein
LIDDDGGGHSGLTPASAKESLLPLRYSLDGRRNYLGHVSGKRAPGKLFGGSKRFRDEPVVEYQNIITGRDPKAAQAFARTSLIG